ncbi:MAG: hypothetical protein HY707_06475 [Ignavibacteriae bacterium]|nr:hypothetical protein [Ignavibacteriota bacterium]
MRQFTLITLFIAFLYFSTVCAQQLDIPTLYDSLSHPILDENAAALLTNHLIIRGRQEIAFTNGMLRLVVPVKGNVFGAVYTGHGTFTLSPATPLEKSEFERQTFLKLQDGKYIFTFDRAVLWFHDTLFHELGQGIRYERKDIDRKEREALERSLRYCTDKVNDNVLYHLMTEMLEQDPKPYLFAHFFLPEKNEIFFSHDLRRFEEITIYKPPFEAITGSVYWLQMVNSFHLLEEYSSATEYELAGEKKQRYDFLSNTIILSIEKGGKTRGRANVHLRAITPYHSTLTFMLDPKLSIDSITTPAGDHVIFHRNEEAWEGFLQLPQQDSLDYFLNFSYSGNFLKPYIGGVFRVREGSYEARDQFYDTRKVTGSFYELSSSTGWYPSQTHIDRMLFDITYRVPSDMQLVSAGRKLSETTELGQCVLRYVIKEPSINASFSLGFYKPKTFHFSNDEPPVTIYDIEGGDPEEVAKDLHQCYRLYKHLFGNTLDAELKIAAGPKHHGEAFQEFLHLPWFEEYVRKKNSRIPLGRAHEVAHTWWGHGVGAESYHDWWLGEAFAQYSALLYAPFILKTDDPFFEKLKEWKQKVIGVRQFALGSGPVLGSIWLGYRASSAQTPSDYSLSTYLKGAWVLHMLRMMMLDLATLKEDAFKSMMAEFYQTYRGKDASTDDFRKIVEKYFRADMHWFFDQWVYGAEIPTLKCSRSITKKPNGKYSVSLTIEQKDVSKPFILYLPFELKYKNGTTARARLLIDQQKKDFNYELDQEPEKITFNIMESVLCTIED